MAFLMCISLVYIFKSNKKTIEAVKSIKMLIISLVLFILPLRKFLDICKNFFQLTFYVFVYNTGSKGFESNKIYSGTKIKTTIFKSAFDKMY